MAPDDVRESRAPPQARAGGALSAIYFVPAFYVCLAVFGLTALAWSLPAGLLRRLLPGRRGERLGQFGIMACLRWFVGVMRVTGVLRADFTELDGLRDEPGIVIAPNHPTMLDAVLLISRLPRIVCISKATLWDNTFLGGGIRLAGYVRNDMPLPMIRRAASTIQEGGRLLIFPEGSRTGRYPVDRFHRSFAVMAKAAGAPVQTVFVEADSPYLTKGWPLFRRPVLPLVFRFRLGRRFEVGSDPEAFTRALEDYFRDGLRGRFSPGR
jgi:1-acyl-sn-glycerol-3-phosphate acyltransferase